MAVTTQVTAVNKVKKLYNHLVDQCNEIIDAKGTTDFCLTLPDGTKLCRQNDLNILKNYS